MFHQWRARKVARIQEPSAASDLTSTTNNKLGGPAEEAIMRPEASIERVRRELHRVLDKTRADIDRIEILTAALSAFGRPVPDYEPGFRHLRHLSLAASEIL